ncbi:hypothetical protein BXZ70DRAFT_900257 [Cristinia sonorae]|uniref:Uncharacterized protein n=1 Tax=Cristinia sonorae TaxID=1940300 RepID=A0A8K0UHJ7_9AGAR|nr:hypothetical protein BXZ70DRAFT_900257 [Cristinia sonorae]
MFTKILNSVKRPTTPGLGPNDDENIPPRLNVMSSVREQHPNMSIFHQEQEQPDVPFPSPSPPTSPSRSRHRLFKRMSKNPFNDSDAASHASSKLNIGSLNLKKAKASLQSISTGKSVVELFPPLLPQRSRTAGSEMSLSRPSTESPRPQDEHASRPSMDSVLQPPTPITPHEGGRFGSIRSILKSNNTPGTGASVRFFSRDAYKTISPEASNNSSTSHHEDPSFFTRLQQKNTSSRPSVMTAFSSPSGNDAQPSTPISPTGITSLMMPIPPPNMTNIFDLSEEKDLPTIPAGINPPLLDSAIEISEDFEGSSMSLDHSNIIPHQLPVRSETPVRDLPKSPPGMHDRSQSFSFGQTVFYSMAAAESTPAGEGSAKSSTSAASISKSSSFAKNRSRAMSDTVFHTMIHSPQSALMDTKRPEADINDTSSAMLVLSSPGEKEKDPFGAHAKTYYVPGTVLPPSPPQHTHTRKASREEDLIWSLRTQLALKDELCAQFETELNAKDDVLREWQNRASEFEKECEQRKLAGRNFRKKFAELTKYARALEEEVERSRESSMERSVMDEASGEALRMLHRRIGELERESAERDKKEMEMKEILESRMAELVKVKEELKKKNESEIELQEGIRAAKDEMESMGAQRQSMIQSEEQSAALRAQAQQDASTSWELEKAKITSDNDFLRNEQVALQAQLTDAREEIVKKEEELAVLRAELEAQWKHTEKSSEDVEKLTQERDDLKAELESLNSRISSMEMDWNDNENKKIVLENEIQELWAAKDDADKERDELEAQLRQEQDHAAELTQALHERESRVTLLTQERQYAQDMVSRLQENLRQRADEIDGLQKRFRERDEEVESIREEMLKSKRDHARIVDDQSRRLSEVVAREVESRAHMESVVREKAEIDVVISTLQERGNALKEEVERLRRQVHELQQESADKEVKLVQAAKQRAQDKEDLQGLNIALDSKQQELELLKRRVSLPATRPTAANTPATASKTAAPSARRESSIFGTPSIASRPPSVLSDAGSVTKETRRKLSDPPVAAAKTALGRSGRANALTTTTAGKRVEGSMGPPPLKRAPSLAGSVSSTASATPTRLPSGTKPRPSITPTVVRKPSVSNDAASKLRSSITSRESLKTVDEKENVKSASTSKSPPSLPSPPTAKPARRMSALIG